MNDVDPSDQRQPARAGDPGAATSDPRGRGGTAQRVLVWLPALTFLVGAALGAVVMGVAGNDHSDPAAVATPEPTASASSAAAPGDTAVTVPAECLAVADSVDEITTLLRDNVEAIRDFRTQDIVDMLNRLEELDQQTREQANACRDIDISTISPSASTTG